MEKIPDQKKELKNKSDLVKYAGMGTQMIAVMLLFAFGGHKLDQWLELKTPILTIVLSLVGVFVALYLVLKDLMKK
jgi:hypothetical protein